MMTGGNMAENDTILTGEQTTTPYRQIRALYDDDTITVYQAYNEEIAAAATRDQKLDASPRFRPGRMTWIKPSWCWMMYRAGYSYKDANQARILALRTRRQAFLELLEAAVPTTTAAATAGDTDADAGHATSSSSSAAPDSGGTPAPDQEAADPTTAAATAAAAVAAAAAAADAAPVGCRIGMDGAESAIGGAARARARTPPTRGGGEERGQRKHKKTRAAAASTDNIASDSGPTGLVRVQWDPERSPRLGRLDWRSIQIGVSGEVARRWIEHGVVGIEDVTPAARALKAALDERPDVTADELRALGLVPEERVLEMPEGLMKRLGMD